MGATPVAVREAGRLIQRGHMKESSDIRYDEPTGRLEQRVAGIVLLCLLALVLWRAQGAIADFFNFTGNGKTRALTIWLLVVAVSPLLLYVGVGLVAGRFRERGLFPPVTLIVIGSTLTIASAGLMVAPFLQHGLDTLSAAPVGGIAIGVAVIQAGRKKRGVDAPGADVKSSATQHGP